MIDKPLIAGLHQTMIADVQQSTIIHLQQSRDMWRRIAFRQMIAIIVLCCCLAAVAIADLAK